MDKGKMHYLIGIVYQYGGSLIVSDWELKVRGDEELEQIFKEVTDNF